MALMKLVSDFLALPGLVVPIAVPSRNGYGFPVRDHRTTTLAVRADARDHDPCRDSTGIWTTPFEVGGPAGGIAGNPIGGGTPWCETRFTDGQTHDVITGIHVWFKKKIGINAIQFTYSGTDQQPTFYGHNTQEENDGDGSITLAAGEIITQLSLWNDQGDKPRRLGRILMVTSAGQTPDVGSVRNDAVEQQVRDLGGGLLVGAYGGEGSSIDYIAFLFLKSKIDKTSITDIQYTNLPAAGAADSSIQTVALLDTTVGNSIDNTHDITVAVGVDQQDTKSSTYSQSVTAMFGQAITAEVSFEVLGVGGKITDEFHWEVFTQITHEISSSEAVTLQTTLTETIAPGEGQHCTITIGKGDGSFDYTSNVTLELADGSNIAYVNKGTLASVQFTSVSGTCEPENDPSQWKDDEKSLPAGVFLAGKGSSQP